MKKCIRPSYLYFLCIFFFPGILNTRAKAEESRIGAMPCDTFYLDPVNASTNGTGRTADDPARKLPSSAIGKPGTVLLYKRGIVVRGKFEYFSGTPSHPVIIGSYGEGPKPLFMGSMNIDNKEDWEMIAENIWKYRINLKDSPGANIIYNNNDHCGSLRWNKNGLAKQGDWCMVDTTGGKINQLDYLYIYSEGNPADVYQNIEYVPEGHFMHFREPDSCMVIKDIAIKNIGTHGIRFYGGSNIRVENCDLSYIGGAIFKPRIGHNGMWVRYGNALEVWRKGKNITIEGCRVFETYDAGFVAQGSLGSGAVDSVVVYNNIFWNNGFDNFDNSWGESITRLYFENNTCVNAGDGWAYETEGRPRLSEFLPDTVGWHIFLDSYAESTIWIRNNIFYNAEDNKLLKADKLPASKWKSIILDYNCYFQEDIKDAIIQINDKRYWSKDFKEYQLDTGNDMHSIVADPLFIDIEKNDFRLRSNSPCLNIGYPGYGGKRIGAYLPSCN